MLEMISKAIAELPELTFEQYFQNYVTSVQDNNIENEVQFILRNNFLNVMSVAKLIDTSVNSW